MACEKNDNLDYIVDVPLEDITFSTSFLNEYVITQETLSEAAETFTWNSIKFEGTPTEVTYDLQYALTDDFSGNINSFGTTKDTSLTITEEQFLKTTELLDENDLEDLEQVTIYTRVRAFVGNGGINAPDIISETQQITLVLPEISGAEISEWGIVGSGYNDWGATPDAPFYTTSEANVFVAYVTLLDGEIKFRKDNDWTVNFGDSGADGTLEEGGDNIISTAGTYKISLNFNDNTYTIEEFSLGIVGSGFNDWGATPDAQFHYDYTTDTFKTGVRLLDGEIKFRLNNAWDTNYGGVDGVLEINGDNIVSSAGFYEVIVDLNNNTYSIEPADVWGIVGSGYNDWGNSPDFYFTQVNPGIYVANNVTLLDGEIKFRLNEAWDDNYGDTGADGILDAGGDNIISSAGTYRIELDFTNPESPTYSIIEL